MRETRPGTWRGQIGFTTQPDWNAVNAQYMQQLFDLDLNKLPICTDPAKRKRVDALGNACL